MKGKQCLASALAAALLCGGLLATANSDYVVQRPPEPEEAEPADTSTQLDWVREMQALLEQELAKKAEEASPQEKAKLGNFEMVLPPNFDFVLDPFEKEGRGQVFSEPMLLTNKGQGIVKVTLSRLKADKGRPERARDAKKEKQTEPIVVGYSAPLAIGESDTPIQYAKESPPQPKLTPGESLTIGQSQLTIGESAPPPVTERKSWDDSITFSTEPVKTTLFEKEKRIQLLLHRLDQPVPDLALSPRRSQDKMVFILHPGQTASFELTGTLNPTPEEDWQPGDINITATYDVEVITEEQEALYWEEERLKEVQRLAKIEAAKKAAQEAANPALAPNGIVSPDYVPPTPSAPDPNAPLPSYGKKVETE